MKFQSHQNLLKCKTQNYPQILLNKSLQLYGIKNIKEAIKVSRQKSMMSEQLKTEIAKELGVYDTVASEGWGSVSSRDCGNIVKKAIEMAERNLIKK